MEGQIRGKARRACDGDDDDGKRMVLNRGTATLWLLVSSDELEPLGQQSRINNTRGHKRRVQGHEDGDAMAYLPETRRGKEAASLPPLQFYQHHLPAARAQSNGASNLGRAVAGTSAQTLRKTERRNRGENES